MLNFVTKNDYWKIEDSGILQELPQANFLWHLKSIQDAVAFQHLREFKGKSIAEIGGGNSRVLQVLSKNNTCFNIDKFKGDDQGPKQEIKFKGVTNINCFLGDSGSSIIPDNSYDIIFSVSVIEHIGTDNLENFYKDCHRIIKPNGFMLHLIDMYLEDTDRDNSKNKVRMQKYIDIFENKFFTDPNAKSYNFSPENPHFSCSYASNPDNAMNVWNKLVPELRGVRELAQSCTILQYGWANK